MMWLVWLLGILSAFWLWEHVGGWLYRLLVFFGRLLMPFWIALIFAYLLNPFVARLERLGLGRTSALRIVFALFVLGGGTAVYASAPAVAEQVQVFERALPQVFDTLSAELQSLERRFDGWPEGVRRGLDKLRQMGNRMMERGVVHLTTLTDDAFEWLMTVSLSPFIAYYLLKDSRGFMEAIAHFFPRRRRPAMVRMLLDIDRDIGDYVGGQLFISLILGALTFVGYLLIGFPYAFVFAVISMFTNLIPFIGPFLGAFPAIVVAFTVSWKLVLWTLLVNVVAQFVENNLLSPLVTGRATEMHPLVVIFVVMLGGELAGILGMVFAVPVAVIMRGIARHVLAFWTEEENEGDVSDSVERQVVRF
ncbi:MAG: AI-2E family transporter [Hydrogenibacillus sp.]|nr:AI-2E family transporter [Hydrogenibacillus sp.]